MGDVRKQADEPQLRLNYENQTLGYSMEPSAQISQVRTNLDIELNISTFLGTKKHCFSNGARSSSSV